MSLAIKNPMKCATNIIPEKTPNSLLKLVSVRKIRKPGNISAKGRIASTVIKIIHAISAKFANAELKKKIESGEIQASQYRIGLIICRYGICPYIKSFFSILFDLRFISREELHKILEVDHSCLFHVHF